MNFLMLRAAERAQSQIHQAADEAERHFAGILPVTHAAFVEHGRRAP
jgi:thymidylate synthase ThyX